MSFAVNHYFQNGGTDALIVRIVNNVATAEADFNGLKIAAANPGTWGGRLEITIDHDDGVGGTLAAPLFNMKVHDLGTDLREAIAACAERFHLSVPRSPPTCEDTSNVFHRQGSFSSRVASMCPKTAPVTLCAEILPSSN